MKKEDIETEAAVYEDSCHNPSIQRHFIDGAEWAMEEMIDKAKKAFCRTTCKGYQDIGKCLCDGNCDKYNKFIKLLEE